MSCALPLPSPPERWKSHYRLVETPGRRAWVDHALAERLVPDQLDAPERLFETHAAVWYKQGRNLLAEIQMPEDVSFVLKRYGSRGLIGAARNYLRPGRPLRAWRQAFALLERGVDTPRPLWLSFPRANPRRHASFVAVQTAAPHTRLREALKQIRKGATNITLADGAHTLDAQLFLDQVARFTRRMHDSGVHHRDYSGGNLLVPHDWRPSPGGAAPPFLLIDINRCRIRPPGHLPPGERLRDLERVSLPPERRPAFFKAYAGGEAEIQALEPRYLRYAANYRRLRQTRNPLARFLRKTFTYWLRFS